MDGFDVGDVVKWESHAGGCWKKKQGKVVAIVPVGSPVKECIPPNAGWKMKKQAAGHARRHVSYLINAEGYGTELLWPVVSGLKLVSTEGITQAIPTAVPAAAPAVPAAAPAVPAAAPDDGMEVCIGCGARLLSCDLDADGMCTECLEEQEKAIEAGESEEAKKA